MSKGRSLKAIAAGAMMGLMLAACGGGGGSNRASALDPANMVPRTALEYMAITVRPQGSLKAELTHTIDTVAGNGATRKLVAKVDSELATADHGVFSQLEGWVGRRVGFALTGYPQDLSGGLSALLDDILIVAPTNNPSTAKSFLASHFNGPDESGSVVGNYAIFGGQAAVGAALATTHSTSLASSTAYQAEIKQLGPNQLLTIFARQGAFMREALPQLQSQANANPILHEELPTLIQEVKHASDTALAISASPHALRVDVVEQHAAPGGAKANSALSALPGDSWLALHLGGTFARKGYLHMLMQIIPTAIAQAQARVGTKLPSNDTALNFVEKDLLPALGPISFAVSGTTKATARFGVELTPASAGAGARLVTAIRRLIKGQPVKTGDSGGNILLTYGYKAIQDFITPSSTLGASPAYRSAVAELPAGSKPDVYLTFAPIAALLALDHSSNTAEAERILSKFDYLIGGGTPTHFRLVLTVR